MKSFAWIPPFVCFLIIIGTLIWAIPHGLDFTDEGFYLIHLTFPDRYPTLYGFGNIYQSALGWCCTNVIHWRNAKLVQGILGGMLFAITIVKLVPKPNAVASFWAVFCMNFVSFSLYLQTISYNDLNNFLVILSSIAVLWSLKLESKITVFLLLLGGGICLGLNFFNKSTASFAMLGWTSLFLISCHCFKFSALRVSVWAQILAFLIGYFFGFCLFFALIKPFDLWIKDYLLGLEASATYMDSIGVWLGNYLKYLVRSVGFVVFLVLPWWAVGNKKKYKIWIILFATLWILTGVYLTHLVLGGEKGFSKLALVYLTVIALQFVAIKDRLIAQKCSLHSFVNKHKEVLFIAFFLFIIPFACSLGSTNSLTRQASFHLIFWGGVIVILNSISTNWQSLPAVIGILVLVQITSGTLNPYAASATVNPKHPVTLQDQTVLLENIEVLRGLKLDATTAASLLKIKFLTDSLSNFTDNQAIFFDLPALNYLTATQSPGTDWFYFLYEPHNKYIISKLKLKTLPLLGILNHRKPGELTQKSLGKIGIKMDKYVKVGSFSFPTQSDTLQLYAPRR